MLRHTYASHMTIIGVHPARLQKLMGHSSISETERYIHLAPTDTQDAVKQLESARDADAARVAA
jgi:site-specific recombinase XerD